MEAAERRSGFGELSGAVRALAGNPVLRREWRALLHETRAAGPFRWPRTVRAWVLPALVLAALTPYLTWALVAALGAVAPQGVEAPRLQKYDLLADLQAWPLLWHGFLAVALLAPAVAGERERGTWEALRNTGLSSHELLLGLLVGRAGPLAVGSLLVGLGWAALRSHYAPLLQPYSPYLLDRSQIVQLAVNLFIVTAAAGCTGLAASAWCRSTRTALILALAAWAGVLITLGSFLQSIESVPGSALVLRCGLVAILAGYPVALAGIARPSR